MPEDIKTPSAPSAEEIEAKAKVDAKAAEQDLLKSELEKVKTKKTQKEKLIYTKNRIEQQLKELDPDAENLESDEDDDKPITRKELKELQARNVTKSALQLADEIENETERELVKHYLNNKIRSSGNPQEDVSDARALANKVKNAKIAEMANQRPGAVRTSSQGGGMPYVAPEEELSPQEVRMMKAPWNLTKKAILDARKQTNKSAGVETRGDDTQV